METVDKGPRARKSPLKQFYGKSNCWPTKSESDPTHQLFEQASAPLNVWLFIQCSRSNNTLRATTQLVIRASSWEAERKQNPHLAIPHLNFLGTSLGHIGSSL